MTDRKLLEMAAKAAGVTIKYNYLGTQDARCVWNPLEDDGEAFRLAMTLGLAVVPYPVEVAALHNGRSWSEPLGDDSFAAARRAIVRAAAELTPNA